jgi:hypothetical protein
VGEFIQTLPQRGAHKYAALQRFEPEAAQLGWATSIPVSYVKGESLLRKISIVERERQEKARNTASNRIIAII